MSNEKGELKAGVDLDTILIDEAGQFGKYQIVTLILAAFPIIFSACASGEYIFTTARINSRCRIRECDGPNPEFAPSWVLNAIPGTSLTSFESCERFGNVTSPPNVPEGFCPANLFNTSWRKDCEDYVYENQLSIVYDFNLACDEWHRSLIGSLRPVGTMFALPITGYISDRWGRRVALTINAFNTGWIGLVRSFVNSYEWFLTLEILETAMGAGSFSVCYVLATELVGPKYRVMAGVTVSSIYAVGQMVLGFVAWGVQSWRPFTRVLYAPQLLLISYFWIISESVRWLISKGRYEDSEKILKKLAKTNKKELSEKSLEALRATAEAEKNTPKPKEPWLPVLVFRSRTILFRCIVSPIWWTTNILVYFGMSVNSVNLVGNSFLNFVAVAAIEIPGFWTAIPLLDRVGRKPVIISGYLLCAACQFAFAFLPEDGYSAIRLILFLFGKYFIAMVVTSVYVYTAELFPTRYRQNLFAFPSTIGRIGAIIAPLTPALASEVWKPLPPVMFGIFALVSAASMLVTPETLGTNLPDTFEEAEKLDRK